MCLRNSPLKMFHRCFLTHTKTAWFVTSLVVLEKWKVSAGLQTYPKKVLSHTHHARKALEKGAPGA